MQATGDKKNIYKKKKKAGAGRQREREVIGDTNEGPV